MKLYQTAQKDLVYIGIGPYDPNKKNQLNPLIFWYALCCTLSFTLTGAYLFLEANDFEEYLECIYVLSTSILSPIAVASVALQLDTMFPLIEKIEAFFDARAKCTSIKGLYEEAAERAEFWTGWISAFAIKIIPAAGAILMFITATALYFFSDLGDDMFVLAAPMWFPFNYKNPMGYAVAMSVEGMIGLSALIVISSLVSLAIDCFVYVTSATKDMIVMLEDVNRNAEVKKDRPQILKQLCEFVAYHSELRQFSLDNTSLYQPIFASVFIWSLITMTGAMLMIEMELKSNKETNTMTVFVMGVEVLCAFSFVSVSCELGERFAGAFNDCNDLIDQFKWYQFPDNVQKIFPLFLIHMQQPVALKCFGSVFCVREALKSVMNTAYSYFMVLRKYNF